MPPKIELDVLRRLGAELRANYDSVLEEPVPAELLRLADELDEALARAERDQKDEPRP